MIVSKCFTVKLEKLLQLNVNDYFDPGYVTGFNRKYT